MDDEYDRMLDYMEHTNKRMFAWLIFCFLQAVAWMSVALWALAR